MVDKTRAADRLERLLSVIPWVAAHDGPTIAEVCARFDVGERELLEDLETASMVGAWPRTPDELVEVIVEDDRVWVYFARSFDRPLQLTPAQGLSLLAAAAGVLSREGTDPNGPLASGLRKLAATMNIDPEQAIEVDFGGASQAVLEVVQQAHRQHRSVRIDYYAAGRDERSERVVDPLRVFTDQGQWYLLGWCHRADDERVFRVDRIHRAELLDGVFEPREPRTTGAFEADPDAPRITLDLAPDAQWVAERYPVEQVERMAGDRLRVTMAVAGLRWLEGLLVRLGRDATVVEHDAALPDDLGARAASRVLDRYR